MVAVSGLLTLIASPIVLPVLYLADLVSGHWRGRLVRYWLLAGAVVWTEITGVIAATAIGLWFANGRRNPSGWMAANYRIECWWGRRHYRNLNIFAGVSIELDNPDILHGPPTIVLARHSSHIDALIPLLFVDAAGRRAFYTLKQDLKWAPAMDIVGDRTHNVWIDRAPRPGSPLFGKVEQLAARMTERDSCVIFPEGTFRTPERHASTITRLRRNRPDLADRAERLRYVLAPRPAGTLALLRGAPEADVVILANYGVEGRSSISEILATITEKRPVVVHGTRHARASLPTSDEDIASWLVDRWLEMDDWIHDHITPQPNGA
jgi:1-acyl-sn-glycerol-3-phosphate acyltransferase